MGSENQQLWSLKVDGSGVVWLAGEVDYTVTPKLRSSLLKYIQKTTGPIQMNLSKLVYLDSSGLAVLIEVRRHLLDSKREFKIESVTPEVKKIFELTQVGQLFGL